MSLAVLLSVVTALVRGAQSYQITVGSANVLAIGKATQTPGGFPGFTQAALAKHNKLETADDKTKTRSVWIQEVLELLMVEAAGPRITLLALQEIDLPLHKGLVAWKKKHKEFQFWNVNGDRLKPNGGADQPYLVSNQTHQTVTCPGGDTNWGNGRKMMCTIRADFQEMTGLFVHGDSGTTQQQLTGDFDFVIGDFNAKGQAAAKKIFGGDAVTFLEGQGDDNPSLLRSVFKLRKVSQQLENSCGFRSLACGAAPPCSCNALWRECCNSGGANDINVGYAGEWCKQPVVTTDVMVKQCKAAAKLCKGFKVEREQSGGNPKLVFVTSEDVGGELSTYGEAAAPELLAKSKAIGYDWTGFAADMRFKLGEMDDKFTCPSEATTEERNEELLANVKLTKLREDFIVVKGDKFKTDATAKVWGYAKAAAEAKGNSLAPTESWPSDHFPIYATLTLNAAMTAVDRLHQGKSSRAKRSATASAAARSRVTRQLLRVLRRMTMKLRSTASGRNADRK